MVKTIIAAILTFLGLKGGEFIVKVFKWVLVALSVLLTLKIAVPLTVWYFKSLLEVLAPFTFIFDFWDSLDNNGKETAILTVSAIGIWAFVSWPVRCRCGR